MTRTSAVRTNDLVARLPVERAERLAVAIGMKATGSTPFAVVLQKGVDMEKLIRRRLEAAQEFWGRTLGLASRNEVRRLHELVRSLEHRLEEVEEAPRTAKSPRPRG